MVDKEFYHNEAKWRARLKPFVVGPGERRIPTVRESAKEQTGETYDGDEIIDEYVQLSLQRYISYRMMWDRIDIDAAQQDFWAAVEAAESDAEDSQGEPAVWVKDNRRKRCYKGSRQSTMSMHQRRASPRSGSMADITRNGLQKQASAKGSDDDDDEPMSGHKAAKRRRMTGKGPGTVDFENSDCSDNGMEVLGTSNMVACFMGVGGEGLGFQKCGPAHGKWAAPRATSGSEVRGSVVTQTL